MTKPIRQIRIEGNIAYVPLTKGYEAVIDAVDVPLVEGWNWHTANSRNMVYAVRREYSGMTSVFVKMHVLIGSPPDGFLVDHINGNGIDNRRANLRHATRAQNSRNQGIASHNTSGFKGVSIKKGAKKYRAAICIEGKMKHLGLFPTAEKAHAAYVAASLSLHGEFGRRE
ncbi:MAG: HNH endonuclease [Candidatus Pacebacteria bacterium]|nr:HNH endonuclease [Candidatus Paceibacterota bacterium]